MTGLSLSVSTSGNPTVLISATQRLLSARLSYKLFAAAASSRVSPCSVPDHLLLHRHQISHYCTTGIIPAFGGSQKMPCTNKPPRSFLSLQHTRPPPLPLYLLAPRVLQPQTPPQPP